MKRLLLKLFLIAALANPIAAHSATTQTAITVTRDQIVSDFPDKLTFQLTANSSADIQNIKLLYRTNGATCQSAIAQQVMDFTPAASVAIEWELDFIRSGFLPPGAEIYWQWQINDAAGNSLLTNEQTYRVSDTRHSWNLLTSGQVSLQWYQGSSSFGQTLMDIAVQSLERLAQDAGVRPTGGIWITVYPTPEEVQEVDIQVTEWAGGVAYPEYNSTILAIAPDEQEWAGEVIPHELAHMVSDALVFNCRGLWLPTWLSEGLAMYAEGELNQYYVDLVSSALEHGNLPPLRTLERGFSSDPDAASLSYGQSAMVVTYMIDEYGAQKMADLLATIQSGSLIDDALQTVFGKDTDGLEAEWRISLGYEPQPTQAPTGSARTAVPTLALWTSVVRPSETPSSSPTLVPTQPIPTDTPQPSQPPQPTETAGAPTPTQSQGKTISNVLVLLIATIAIIVILLLATVILVIILRRRRRNP